MSIEFMQRDDRDASTTVRGRGMLADWREATEAERSAAAHARQLRLVRAAALWGGLALTLALVAAWEADRWLTDAHYAAGEGLYLPEGSE